MGGSSTDFKLNTQKMKILKTIAMLRMASISKASKEQVQIMSGNSKTKAGFDKNLGQLKKAGFLVYVGANVELTEKGLAVVGDVDPSSLSTESFHENIKKVLSKKGGSIFDFISDGKKYNKMDVAKALGYDLDKLSGFEKDLSKMSSLGFLVKDKETMQLTAKCFIAGRA